MDGLVVFDAEVHEPADPLDGVKPLLLEKLGEVVALLLGLGLHADDPHDLQVALGLGVPANLRHGFAGVVAAPLHDRLVRADVGQRGTFLPAARARIP